MSYTIRLSELLNNSSYSAMEADSGQIEVESKVDNPEAPMAIALITDKIIMNSGLKPVSDPISFGSGGVPTDNGLFSDIIFGREADSRQRQFAYINLHEKFFYNLFTMIRINTRKWRINEERNIFVASF